MPDNAVHEWLRDARGDLALASVAKTRQIRYAHLCFHAQQAAEKSLKAVLLASNRDMPRTHDLAFLMDALPENANVPPALLALPTLNKYAVQYRYPGQDMPIHRRDWLKAIAFARDALDWAALAVDRLRRHRP